MGRREENSGPEGLHISCPPRLLTVQPPEASEARMSRPSLCPLPFPAEVVVFPAQLPGSWSPSLTSCVRKGKIGATNHRLDGWVDDSDLNWVAGGWFGLPTTQRSRGQLDCGGLDEMIRRLNQKRSIPEKNQRHRLYFEELSIFCRGCGEFGRLPNWFVFSLCSCEPVLVAIMKRDEQNISWPGGVT